MKVTKIIKNGERFFIKILKVTTFVVSSLLATSVFSTESTEEVSSHGKELKSGPALVTKYVYGYYPYKGKIVVGSLSDKGVFKNILSIEDWPINGSAVPMYNISASYKVANLYLVGQDSVQQYGKYPVHVSKITENGFPVKPTMMNGTLWSDYYDSIAPIAGPDLRWGPAFFAQTRKGKGGNRDYFISYFYGYDDILFGSRVDTGTWNAFYDNLFSYRIGNQDFIMGQSKADNSTFISEVTQKRKIGRTRYSATWEYHYSQMFPVIFGSNVFYFGRKNDEQADKVSYVFEKLNVFGIEPHTLSTGDLGISPKKRSHAFPYYDKDGNPYIVVHYEQEDTGQGCNIMNKVVEEDGKLRLHRNAEENCVKSYFPQMSGWNVPTSVALQTVN